MEPTYQYSALGHHVVDGDTIDVELDFGFRLRQEMRLRLAGIDTPEMNSEDEEDRERAYRAKKFVEEALFKVTVIDENRNSVEARDLVVKTIKTRAGKEKQTFGRYVAEVYVLIRGKWIFLNQALVDEGLAEQSRG